MEKKDIINALELVKQKAEKRKYMDHIFNLKRMIRESEETLAQKREKWHI